jgi:pyruvate/2-oxoacid:ferredoxin oxidoreductase alpha subunit
MHELLHWASGARAPIVMGITNRAVAPPLSIWTDHRDTVSQRDTGWIQMYVESAQEVLDSVLVAFRVAEDPEVLLPAMVAEDGFYLSHTYEPVDIPSQEQADRFLPPRRPSSGFRPGIANRYGTFTGPDLHMEFQRKVAEGMERVPRVFREAEAEYERITGRNHGGPMPTYRTEDADAVLVTMGTATTTARSVVDALRKHGKKVGLAKLRMFRPWPVADVRDLGADVDRIGVLDRSFTFGASGAAHTEFAAAMYGSPHRPMIRNFVAGLGGRDLTPATFTQMFESLLGTRKEEVDWLGLKHRPEVIVRG